MSIAGFAKAVRNARNFVEINVNRKLGREFVPRGGILCLETSSTCNLKCRFCAYEKKTSPKVSMSFETFERCVGEALEMGYRRFQLTPCTGDVFMDRGLFRKLELLERLEGVAGYEFFTNLTIPGPDQIERLAGLSKLGTLTVSVYGHDLASFRAITLSTEKVYRRLLSNLETLYGLRDRFRGRLALGFRTVRHVPRGSPSECLAALKRFRDAGFRVRRSRVYNNWGGTVTQADVAGLDLEITPPGAMYKKGACALLFTHVQVMATGIVNGCSCRDVDATLRIGDITSTPLREIISTANPAYVQLIEEQQRGEFRPVCQACDFYKSIYHLRSSSRRSGEAMQTLAEFLEQRQGAARLPSATDS